MQRKESSRQYLMTVTVASGNVQAALPGADGEKGIMLAGAELEAAQRGLSQTSGATVMTAPSLVLRAGQRGEIQTIEEVPVPVGKNEVATDCVGLIIPLEVIPWGEVVHVRGTVDIGTQTPDGTVRHDVTGFDLWLPNGTAGGFTLEHTGSPAAALVKVQEIGPDGQPR
jgi:hypothetical protein